MADDDEPVPRIPHPRGFRLSTAALVRVGLTGGLLVLVIAIQRPCADSVSKFVTSFGDEGSAAARMPKPGTVEEPSGRGSAADYEPIRAGMTEAEIKAAIERSKAKAAERAAAERAAAERAAAESTAAGSAGSAAAGSGSGR